jgi:hypothetical protein
VKKSMCLLAMIASLLLIASPASTDDGFYVIAAGGKAGKVLKTQVFTNYNQDNTLGTDTWTKLPSPQWTYTKLSGTSYLVITYQDSIWCTGNNAFSVYALRVNDLPGLAAQSAVLMSPSIWIFPESTGVWSELPKGEVNLSIWHYQSGCTVCQQCAGNWGTKVIVMEIEN